MALRYECGHRLDGERRECENYLKKLDKAIDDLEKPGFWRCGGCVPRGKSLGEDDCMSVCTQKILAKCPKCESKRLPGEIEEDVRILLWRRLGGKGTVLMRA